MAAEHTAHATWDGDLMTGFGTVSAGSGVFSGVSLTWRARAEDASEGSSPEELIAAASTIPWTLPVGLVSGRFRSPCASSQIAPPGPAARASPPSVPSATEWSPPSTSGRYPSDLALATSSAISAHVALISSRKRARSSP